MRVSAWRLPFRWALVALLASALLGAHPKLVQAVNIPVNIVSGGWTEGTGSNRTVATFTDPGCAPGVSYTAIITWGDGSTLIVGSGASISGTCAGGFTVSAGHLYAEEGTVQLSVAVTGTDGNAGNGSNSIAVADAAITVTSQFRIEPPGVSFTVSVSRFTDGDVFGSLVDYTAQIDWGDGSVSIGVIQQNSPPVFDVVGSHTYAGSGTYNVPVSVRDTGGATATATSTLLVGAAIVAAGNTVRSVEGQAFSGAVATFADTLCDPSVTYTAPIVWGDGVTTAGVLSGNCIGGFTVLGTHTFAEGGTYVIQVPISGSNASGGTATGAAIVADAPLTGSGITFSVTQGTAISRALGTFTDAGPSGGATDYRTSIDWGDGSPPTAGTVSGGPGAGPYSVSGSHTYFTTGAKTVTVTVTDAGGASTSFASTATVAASALSVTAGNAAGVEGSAVALAGASFIDPACNPATDSYTVTISWGDGTVVDSIVVGPGSNCATGQAIAATHVYSRAGAFAILITVVARTNPRGGAATGNAVITRAGLAAGVPGSLSLNEGQPFSGAIAVFADANPAAQPGDFVATIDWGDGTPKSAGTVTNAPGGFGISGSHIYVEQGTFALVATLTSVDGRVAVATSTSTIAEVAVLVAPPNLSFSAGASFAGIVTTFSDPGHPLGLNADLFIEFSATIDWGDGSADAGVVALNSGNTYSVSGSHTYVGDGTNVLIVAVTHNGTTAAGIGTATVNPEASVTGPATITPEPAEPASAVAGSEFSGVIASFTDPDPKATAASFTASIDWGDGTSSAGVVTGPDGGLFTVSGSHTFKTVGRFTVTTTIRKSGGAARRIRLMVNVKAEGRQPRPPKRLPKPKPPKPVAPAQAIALITAVDQSTVESELFDRQIVAFVEPDCGATRYSATIDWDDDATSRGSVERYAGCLFIVAGKHRFSSAGDYDVTVSIHGSNDHSAHAELSVAVDDAALVAWPATMWVAVDAPMYRATVAYFHDADFGGALLSYTATVDWGDGAQASANAITRVKPFGACTHPCFAVAASHTFTTGGNFSATVTIADAGGAAALAASTVHVFVASATPTSQGPALIAYASASEAPRRAGLFDLATFRRRRRMGVTPTPTPVRGYWPPRAFGR
jgi:hypothetical protein